MDDVRHADGDQPHRHHHPSREAWLQQLAYLQDKGVKFDRRVEHGMTHSLYIHDPNGYGVELLYDLPQEVWEGDIDAALNLAKALPTEGAEALRTAPQAFRFSARLRRLSDRSGKTEKHQRQQGASREPDPQCQPGRQCRDVERDRRHQARHAGIAGEAWKNRSPMCSPTSAMTSRPPAAASTTSPPRRAG